MAQNRATSIFAKQEKIAQDLQQVQKTLALLLKEAIKMKKQYGNKAAISKNILEYSKICILLQKNQQADGLILKIRQLFDQCLAHSMYVQHQLLLMVHSAEKK